MSGLLQAATVVLALTALGGSSTAPDATPAIAADDPRLKRVNGLWLVADEPLTGPLIERERDGGETRHRVRGGRLHGLQESRYASGVLRSLRLYANGLKAGTHLGWWPDGSARFVYEFRNGLNEGFARAWHANGQLAEEHHYAAGHEMGLQRMWYEDGSLRANYEVRSGRRYGSIGAKPCLTSGPTPAHGVTS